MRRMNSYQEFEEAIKIEKIKEPDYDRIKARIINGDRTTHPFPKRHINAKVLVIAAIILLVSLPVYSAAYRILAELKNHRGESILSFESGIQASRAAAETRAGIEEEYSDLIRQLQKESKLDEITYLVVPLSKTDSSSYFVKIINNEPLIFTDFESFIKVLYGNDKFPMVIPGIPYPYEFEASHIEYDFERLDPKKMCKTAMESNKPYLVRTAKKLPHVSNAVIQYRNPDNQADDESISIGLNSELKGTIIVNEANDTEQITLDGINIARTNTGKSIQYMFPASYDGMDYVYTVDTQGIPEEVILKIIHDILGQHSPNQDGKAASNSNAAVTNTFMPELKGLSIEDARKSLASKGISEVEVTDKYSEYFASGIVIEQSYPANAPIRSDFNYSVIISRGPDPRNHKDILSLCERKGWADELQPYITASIKFLINNTGLSPEEIYQKLDKNVDKIYIAGKADGIGDRNGVYNGDIVLNRYTFNDYILTHEMLHALSKDASDVKMGLTNENNNYFADNCSDLNEGYVDYIASKSVSWQEKGFVSIGEDGSTSILVYDSIAHAYAREAVIVKSLEQLIGSAEFEKMFFASDKEYMEQIQKFNQRYGSNSWKHLLENASRIIEHKSGDKTQYIKNYYDKLLQCISIDLEKSGDDIDKLTDALKKWGTMQSSIPLEFNDYRKKANDIHLFYFKRLQKLRNKGDEKYVFGKALPDYTKIFEDDLIRWLKVNTNVQQIDSYSTASDTVPAGMIVSVSSMQRGACPPGAIIITEDKDSYTLKVSSGVKLPDGWIHTPDILKKFGNVIYEDNLEESSIYKDLKRMGLKPEFEFIEADSGYESKFLKYRIIGQYPQSGTAIKEGSTLKIRVLVNSTLLMRVVMCL